MLVRGDLRVRISADEWNRGEWLRWLRKWVVVCMGAQLVAIAVTTWKAHWWYGIGNVYVLGMLVWLRIKVLTK